jgi:rod shape-determining protein MreC
MRRFLDFIFFYRAFLLFLILQVFCFALIVRNLRFQGAIYFNTIAEASAGMNATTQQIVNYFSLRQTNEALAQENAVLRTLVSDLRSLNGKQTDTVPHRIQYRFQDAAVVNNTTSLFRNYITIDKGSLEGVEAGMAVTGQAGIVGKVKAVSKNYAVLISLLNIDEYVSAEIVRNSTFGSVHWDGVDVRFVKMLYVPKHVDVWKGDSIVTSGFNAVFPKGLPVGVITDVRPGNDALFQEISVRLFQDFSSLNFVHIIKSRDFAEIDSIQKTVIRP